MVGREGFSVFGWVGGKARVIGHDMVCTSDYVFSEGKGSLIHWTYDCGRDGKNRHDKDRHVAEVLFSWTGYN